jgi:dihydroorotase
MKDSYLIPAAADMHVHLRDGDMSKAVTPTIRSGGVNTVYVMPYVLRNRVTHMLGCRLIRMLETWYHQ